MANRAAGSELPAADLCLRTNAAGAVELYVNADCKEYRISATSVHLRKIESPSFLAADIVAHIARLG
jgi:hypothetical protein